MTEEYGGKVDFLQQTHTHTQTHIVKRKSVKGRLMKELRDLGHAIRGSSLENIAP